MAESCPVCASNDTKVQGEYRFRHPTFAGLSLVGCSSCGMIFASPMPGKEALDFYNRSYFETAHGRVPTDECTLAFFSGIARLRLAHLERYLKSRNIDPKRVLEIGPGQGSFARAWLGKYPDTIYFASETDLACHEALRKCGVELIDTSLKFDDDVKADVIIMSHVLEHVPNPTEYLSEVGSKLRAGGVLFLEVPCLDWKHKPLEEPHVLFFDKQPLGRLLQEIGFSEIELSYHGLEIRQLERKSAFREKLFFLRNRLIAYGLVGPFGRKRSGMESLENALERAMVAPFRAHIESSAPAWWLRGLARILN